jgi:dephospho-CoA kinase
MSFRLGLTGSIGMGKSTTAAMFADAGVPVWDADATVHRLYAPGQPGALALAGLFPAAIGAEGGVDRASLRKAIAADPGAIDRLNAAIHPLVAADRARFLADHAPESVVLLDIPLLFETGAQGTCDAVAVVSAPAEAQRERVLARGMSEADFALILSRQIPDAEKRARADYIIPTTSLEAARVAVKDVLADIQRRIADHA